MRIVPILRSDLGLVMKLYYRFPQRFLSPVMNLSSNTMVNDISQCWGAVDNNGILSGVMLRFSNVCIVADIAGETAHAFAEIIDSLPGLAGVRGSLECTRKLPLHLLKYRITSIKQSTLMLLHRKPTILPCQNAIIRNADQHDIEGLTKLYSSAESMYRSRTNIINKLVPNRFFLAETHSENGNSHVVSAALINVENADSGMIGGVYTHPDYRRRGYAACCTAALAEALQADKKLPSLYFENPEAGRIYSSIGFEPADDWAVLYLTK